MLKNENPLKKRTGNNKHIQFRMEKKNESNFFI